MSETPEERRERLVDEMWKAIDSDEDPAAAALDALLDALEPPVADMVRLGVVPVKNLYGDQLGWEAAGPRSEP